MTTRTFSLADPLPDSSLAIEASAGTGKTFTLAALAARFVAERDVRAGELLVVTFTRAATAELRSRIRDRLAGAADHLAAVESGSSSVTDDPLHNHLAGLEPDSRARAHENLERAVDEFDTATVSTIHGFAGQVLGMLGMAVEVDGGLVDDADDLTEAICADVYVAEAVSGTDPTLLPAPGTLVEIVNATLMRPGLRLVPRPDEAGDLAATAEVTQRMVANALDQIRNQRRLLGQRSFSDLLDLLRERLATADGAVTEMLRSRYRVALIDEFQDTDPVQWAIFQQLFGRGENDRSHLLLVGDPKQAIYSFRGADIDTYLEAVRCQRETRSLDVNWRSDGAVVDTCNALFDGFTFGDDAIAYVPVTASPDNRDRRIVDRSGHALPALDIRIPRSDDMELTTRGEIAVPSARGVVYSDVAVAIGELLDSAFIPAAGHSDDGGVEDGPAGTRRVRPNDVAVLVRTRGEAEAVKTVLGLAGIPAVLARGVSILESPAATEWRLLLEAVGRPADPGRARTFSLGWFGGHDVCWVDDVDEADLTAVQERLASWSAVLTASGVNAFVDRVIDESGVVERLLREPDGDQTVTDLEHLAEILRGRGSGERASVPGLLAVLDTTGPATAGGGDDPDSADDNLSQRSPVEDGAVQIMTIWVAKGLEFPIVCCPTLWTTQSNRGPQIFVDGDGERALNVFPTLKWPDMAAKEERDRSVERAREGETLRLLYVALTRAAHRTVLWWVRANNSGKSPLARVLFDGLDARQRPSSDSETVDFMLGRMGTAVEGHEPICTVTLTATSPPNVATPIDPAPPPATGVKPLLEAARRERVPDRRAERWSFSTISARADQPDHDTDSGRFDPVGTAEGATPPRIADEPDDGASTDGSPATSEPIDQVVVSDQDRGPDEPVVSPLAWCPAGTAFGSLVHAVYELVDFTDRDLRAAVRTTVADQLRWRAVDLAAGDRGNGEDGVDLLTDGIVASIETPLGPWVDGRSLRSFEREDRLDELAFELRLATSARRAASDSDLGALLLEHLPVDDPYREWARSLTDGAYDVDLAGHLTGSIDVVLRVRGRDGHDRYVICDYKTNRLHERGTRPGVEDYAADRMNQEMVHHHYPLQALLYSVALHRYLRWRIADYRPERHLGGVLYLFVRGMAGTRSAAVDDRPAGVCRWDVPPALVAAVSDLFEFGIDPEVRSGDSGGGGTTW